MNVTASSVERYGVGSVSPLSDRQRWLDEYQSTMTSALGRIGSGLHSAASQLRYYGTG
jgi:hypothetical protein